MRSLDEDDPLAGDLRGEGSQLQPAWMRALKQSCFEWLQALPVEPPSTQSDREVTPLGRFYDREAGIARSLLPLVRAELEALVQVCDGERRQTNDLRSLLADLVKGTVPASWRQFRCRDMPVSVWISELVKRLAQLDRLASSDRQAFEPVSLGLLFNPTGFVTASRQTAAHALRVSLEELTLDVVLESAPPAHGFALEGLTLSGAECKPDGLRLNDGSPVQLGTSALVWRSPKEEKPTSTARRVEVPCFLDSTRADILFHVAVNPAADVDPTLVIQRAVAVIAAAD
ncbi:dynein [Rhodotorula sp. JG-1b]|nr:dynein [Rhodotorula sp. JG-1b]